MNQNTGLAVFKKTHREKFMPVLLSVFIQTKNKEDVRSSLLILFSYLFTGGVVRERDRIPSRAQHGA